MVHTGVLEGSKLRLQIKGRSLLIQSLAQNMGLYKILKKTKLMDKMQQVQTNRSIIV